MTRPCVTGLKCNKSFIIRTLAPADETPVAGPEAPVCPSTTIGPLVTMTPPPVRFGRKWVLVDSAQVCPTTTRSTDLYGLMLKPFVVYFKYKCPGDKKPGAVKQYRLYATSVEEARRLVAQHANYPDVKIMRVESV